MPGKLKLLAMAAAFTAGASGAALAQACPPGYAFYAGVCQPAPGYTYAPSNPVSGAVAGEAAGAASGAAAAGPVGAVVGGALGTAAGAVAGTANAVTGATAPPAYAPAYPAYPAYGTSYPPPAPRCPPGYAFYSGGCYPPQ